MTSTPQKREALNALSDKEKLDLIYKLTDSKNIVDLLDFVDQSFDDADWCQSYR